MRRIDSCVSSDRYGTLCIQRSGPDGNSDSHQTAVGQITDNPVVFVGLAISGDEATLYICDGQADKGTVSVGEWFIGSVKDNAIDITAPSGNRAQVKIADPAADGQFTFKDATAKKSNLKLDPKAKLLRSEFTIDGEKYVAGWIVLADGTVRGSVRRNDGKLAPANYLVIEME